ncbi:hypothetical protein [Mesorhizobium sp.]|uniref:hypothetical protein n=1 Tax=Mesorhizobium sp. TaxID=1871066 RepID=UPI0012263B10|nr:hypothetical protein [Mesorhizobium sp.]TIN76776.1 MAG: hypothetical protein E5Y09_21030 [Mesorhizobium sp.]
MDYASLLYGPIYATLSVAATLTLDDTDGTTLELTVLDKTAGAAVPFKGADVLTIKPAVMVRATELAEVDLADLRDATITFNGKTWTVMDHEMAPAPTGEGEGEIRLILEKA